MRRSLLTLALVLPLAASAQSWQFDSYFPDDEDRQFSSTHGLAIDGQDMVWVQPHNLVDSVQVAGAFTASGTVQVFDSNGNEADCSPIRFLADASGAVTDTLGIGTNASGALETQTGRGLTADVNGDILITQGSLLFKVDHTSCGSVGENTVRLLAKAQPYTGSMIAAGTDDAGNFYMGPVVGNSTPATPVRYTILGPDLSELGEYANARTFNRATLVVDDGGGDGGLFAWDFSYTTRLPAVWYRPDDFSDFDSLGVTPLGMAIESATIQPGTDWLWFSAGSGADVPDAASPWQPFTWYAFALEDLFTFDGNGDPTGTIETPTPRDSIVWAEEDPVGRPRAIAFSSDGTTAYVGQFSDPAPATQKFIRMATSNEGRPEWVAVVDVAQNTPNPASGTTTISFTTQQAGVVAVRVYDTTGREVGLVVDESFSAGQHAIEFDTSGLAPGVYVYSVTVNGHGTSRQMTVIR